VDFVRRWSEKAEIGVGRFIPWLGVTASKFIEFHMKNPLEGYRRLTFMMLDADVVAVSPASVWRVLKQAGLLSRWKSKPSRKGTGFEQPLQPHQHWHIDISYINLSGTFYYLCSILDGFSRFLVHWDLRESMRETDVEVILQRAKEKYLEAKPRIISDNGPQFIARDFKEFIRISGMTHVRTSRYARGGGPGPLAFGNARLTDRRAGRRWLFCREECKQRDSNHAKDHNVLGAILPVHPVRHGLRRHDCHREPMGKA
jgi:hypothetical protein